MVDPFDPNDYRKRVLAAVERRGGPETSDPFELYDLPLSDDPGDDPGDAAVAARIAEVWGAWQRQRDHPKYRVLVELLVAGHAERSAELLDAGRRRTAAARVRAQREQRDAGRYALLDAAVARLVDRHGGIPRDKLEGLHEVGALAGLERAEVEVRLRRHRVLGAPAGVAVARRAQISALLAEFGRLTGEPAPPTLLALLGLEPTATPEQVRARAAAWRSRARELPAQRRRAVLDELLVHVAELVEPGTAAVGAYLDAVALDVAEHLRPRVRAAVLVEDRLVLDDHAHLLAEAVARGLDRDRATAVLAGLAAELQAPIETIETIETIGTTGTSRDHAPPARTAAPAWEAPLRKARAALRSGRARAARRHVDDAERTADSSARTRVRAVAGEVDAVLAEADRRWVTVAAEIVAHRFVRAREDLERLRRTAVDVPGPDGLGVEECLAAATAEIERADRAAAAAGGASDRLRAVLAACADHPGALAALAALAAIPVAASRWVSAARDARGDVVVLWAASATPDVVYKVSRLRTDGRRQVVGRVGGTSLEDGGAEPGVEAPVYAVVALQDGRSSPETRSDQAPEPSAPSAPEEVRAVRLGDGSVAVSWTAVTPTAATPTGAGGDAEYRVRCRDGAGRWRVVGRTRGTTMEDGGAPPGPLPAYGVSAAAGRTRSAERLSAEDVA